MGDMLGKGVFMNGRSYVLAALAATLVAAAPAEAKKKQPAPAPAPAAALQMALPNSPNGLNVRYFYERRNYAPIWFRAGAGDEAVAKLVSILRRAPVDGMANGPQLAASVEAAVAAARTGDAMKQKEAELVLSAAWVDYVQVLQRPNNNVIWGDPHLVLKPSHPDRSLALATAAPSLAQHLESVSAVNHIYAALREVAVSEAAAKGAVSDAVKLNMDRARIIPATGKFILVNSAEQRLHMYENGRSVGSMKVVVGDKDKLGLPTPIIASTMHYAIANPYWHVPPHLIRSAVAPNAARQGEAYLKAKGYEVISDLSKNPTILPASSVNWKAVAAGTEKVILRQKPNGENSMGKMKFPFPNREGIFLHDTPRREHFAKANRAISNGCIRVEDYRKLAYWLFGRDVAAIGSDPEQHLSLPRGVPVYVTYLTMVPEASGITRFADRYGWDRPGVMAGGMDAGTGVGAGARDAVAGGSGAGAVQQ